MSAMSRSLAAAQFDAERRRQHQAGKARGRRTIISAAIQPPKQAPTRTASSQPERGCEIEIEVGEIVDRADPSGSARVAEAGMRRRDDPVPSRQQIEPRPLGHQPLAGMQEQQRPALPALDQFEARPRDRYRPRHGAPGVAAGCDPTRTLCCERGRAGNADAPPAFDLPAASSRTAASDNPTAEISRSCRLGARRRGEVAMAQQRIHGLLRAVHRPLRRDRGGRGRPLHPPRTRSRRTRPARRCAPRAAPRRNWSTIRERLTHPLRRTRPKGDPDPGWQRDRLGRGART